MPQVLPCGDWEVALLHCSLHVSGVQVHPDLAGVALVSSYHYIANSTVCSLIQFSKTPSISSPQCGVSAFPSGGLEYVAVSAHSGSECTTPMIPHHELCHGREFRPMDYTLTLISIPIRVGYHPQAAIPFHGKENCADSEELCRD